MKTKLSIAISAALISSATIAGEVQYSTNSYSPEILSVKQYKKALLTSKKASAQRFIIELESPSLSMYKGRMSTIAGTVPAKKGQKINVQSSEAQSYLRHLVQEQNKFASTLSKVFVNAKVERHFQTLFNGVTIVGQGLSIDALMAIPDVKAVYPEVMYETNMDASHEVINSQAMWTAIGGKENAGKGIKVAVIDSGIRPENPMFADNGFAAPTGTMPSDDYCSTVDTTFCNNKLIVARWSQPTFPVCPDEHMSPLGFGGHGTHVAGTAVGNKISTTYKGVDVELSGVAPAAYLMAYKALYKTENCTKASGSNIMLMEALEHAVNDGADVINNSWGGGPGGNPANSPYKTMFEAAEAAGIVVVSAAGNDGNAAKTIGCPACIESGITVANSTTGRFFANSFNTDGDEMLAIEGDNALLETDISLPIVASMNIDSDNFEGCTPFDADVFKGSIALISRGKCAFADKAANAQVAGAEAMVVYNNKAGAPISMHMPDATLPAVMISQENGKSVLDSGAISGTISAQVQRIVTKLLADNIATSSSRGPNGNENILKPDLAAPGTNILSAFSPDDGGEDFNMISGTSMASPHVAGAAAMMTQLHPDWTATDIKTALTSTSKIEGIWGDDAATPASQFAMGAGRMDLDAAAKAVLTFDKPSIAADSCVGPCTFTRTVFNKSDEKTSWNLTASTDIAAITVSPTTLDLDGGASASFTVTVDSTFTDYGSWIFGNIMLKSNEGKQDAHLPLAVMAKESSDSSLVSAVTTATDIKVSDEFPIKAVVNNSLFKNTVTVKAYTPKGTSLTSADDVVVTSKGTTQNGLEINEELGLVTWVGRLDLPEIGMRKNSNDKPSIFDLGIENVPACNEGCDDTSFTITVPSYKYNNEIYSSITISTNGMAIAGGLSKANTARNKKLPDNGNPNNVMAPFWADFDLSDGSEGDAGGGKLGFAIVSTGTKNWIVAEWNEAKLFGDSSDDKYSFSLWIETGNEENISYNYLSIPSMPTKVTIGAENSTGTVGTTYHYNGEGSSINTGDKLNLTNKPAGRLEIDYMVKATSFDAGQADLAEVEEEGTVDFNVLDNDIADQKVARVSITGDGMTAKAQRLIDVTPIGKLGKVSMVTEPENGEITLAVDGTVSYTPNDDFFGKDSFTYTSEDEDGNMNKATTATITVTNVNDAPTVSPSSMSSAEGFVVTANGKDVDGDALTYTWTQTAGTDVTFTNGGESISFTAPSGNQALIFSVLASDGQLSSKAGTVTIPVMKKEKTSAGSISWLIFLFLSFIGIGKYVLKNKSAI
ncbi:S8 family serine peptidase [uncultured Shewanella sp.]|uniref:S8 family serine peptidase n=1 Tax=uncultured Shewanella sp. TaxID=173975 RepID=UPI0026397452|nr:S8 family serine peptidase [uncultured Shewanella sp.]